MKSRDLACPAYVRGAAIGIALFTASSARADYQPNKYVEPGTNQVLEYNLYVPSKLTAGQKYPLLVYLHAASNEAVPHRTLASDGKGWVPQLMTADAGKTTAFYMIPISQTNSSGWGDPVGPITDPEKFEGRLTVVVLKELLDKYPIDRDRLYVTGASMGARGTYDLLRRYPDLFAAGAPCAAPANPADAPIYASQNIWSVMGSADPVAQPNRDTIAAIRKACGNPIYTELDGHGHDSWRSIYPMPEFIAWMFAQRRGVPWPQVSQAPTPAQILAAEQPPVKGLTPSQPEVLTPTNCPTSSAGGTGGGPTSNGGARNGAGGTAAAGASANGGTAGSDATDKGGQPNAGSPGGVSGASAAAGAAPASGESGAGGVPLLSSGGFPATAGPPGSAGAPTNGVGPSSASENGWSCFVTGNASKHSAPRAGLALLAALCFVRFRRYGSRRAP